MSFITKFSKRGTSALATVLLVLSIALGSLFVTPASAIVMTQSATSATGPQKVIQCNIMSVIGQQGQYVIILAGPLIEPTTNSFAAVVAVRDKDGSGSWVNSFTDYAERISLDCTRLLYSSVIAAPTPLDKTSPDISFFYPGDGTIYGYFGSMNRNQSTAAFEASITNVFFGYQSQHN